MTGFDRIEDTVYVNNIGYLFSGQTTYANFTPNSMYSYVSLERKVSAEEVNRQKLDLMPGFRFSWWYSGLEVTPDNKYKDDKVNKLFVR